MSGAHHRFDNDLRYRAADHPAQTALTPEYVLDPIRRALGGIALDPCTTPDNPVGADRFYALPVDGLREAWDARTVFVNPPYGRARNEWVERCINEGALAINRSVALLIPAHTDTRVFQNAIGSADYCCFVRGRIKFGVLRPNRRQVAASHPSAILVWGRVESSALRDLGEIVRGAA